MSVKLTAPVSLMKNNSTMPPPSSALVTYNARHFEPLAAAWFLADKPHAGLIISDELPRGELRRRLENLLRTRTAAELRDTVQWLQAYK